MGRQIYVLSRSSGASGSVVTTGEGKFLDHYLVKAALRQIRSL